MAWAGTGIGRLGLWWQARRAGVPDGAAPPDIPPGGGPLLLVQVSPDARAAFAQVQRRLMRKRPDLRILDAGDPGPAVAEALMGADPAALLLLGSDLPPALILAAARRSLPIILAEARLAPEGTGRTRPSSARPVMLTGCRRRGRCCARDGLTLVLLVSRGWGGPGWSIGVGAACRPYFTRRVKA